MDATAYELQMRRFAEALQPMYKFFDQETHHCIDALQYQLMCRAILSSLGEVEHRLLEVAAKKKFGAEAAAQARKDIEKAQPETAEDSHA